MNSILITGGAGFIGSNLALKIQSLHPLCKITIIDDFSTGDYKNLIGYKGDILTLDVSNPLIFNYLSGFKFDYIVHLASITNTTIKDQKEMMFSNVEGFRNILIHATATDTPVIYASSCAVYGKRNNILNENDKLAPANIYGFSKMIMENIAAKVTSVPVCGLRFSNVFGHNEGSKGSSASMVYQIIRQLKENGWVALFEFGDQSRDWNWVENIIDQIIFCIEKKASGIYNAGSGSSYSFNGVAKSVAYELGIEPKIQYIPNPYKDSYQEYTECDMAKIYTDLGFDTKHGFFDAIKTIINKI